MDFTLNLQTAAGVAAFLNAAAGAAGTASAGAVSGSAVEDGVSFSEVLSQTTGTVQADDAAQTENVQAEDTADETVEAADSIEDERGMIYAPKSALEQITELIGNADDGIQKGLKLLFRTMINAIMGDSTKDKKTDLFSVLTGGSGLFDDDDDFLLGAEIMNQIGIAMDLELAADEDDITDALDQLLESLFGSDEDDTDENTAADILAAMLSPEVQDEIITMVESEHDELSPIGLTAELFRLPKQIVLKEKPEDVPKMEELFGEFKAEIVSKTGEDQDSALDIRSLIGADRSALKVNDAADQIRTIGNDEEVLPEVAAAAVRNDTAADRAAEVTSTEADEFIARSVENQITERITEKLFDMKGDNDTGEMVLILKPENLGQVAVKLVKENGALTVLLSAQYDEVGRLMADRAAALSDSLTNRNVEVKDVRVVDPGSAAEQMGLNLTNQGFSFGRGQEYSSDNSERNSYMGIDEIDEIGETEPEINIIREAGIWQTTA